ncbi:MAG: HlyD family type I secretion periplasmic adaptor subunit [Pseudomonadota bacterium]
MVELAPSPPARTATDARFFLRFGWALIIFVFGGSVLWSVLAPFEGAILASGTVEVASERQAVQHLEGGIVSEINVREGDFVEAGDTLIVLSGADTEARLASVEARLKALVGQEARLLSERASNRELAPGPSHSMFSEDAEMAEIMTAEQELMNARAASRRTQVALLNQTILQLRERSTGLKNEIIANHTQAGLIEEEIQDLEVLYERGLSPRPRILALKRDKAALDGTREALTAEVAATEIQIGETELELNRLTEGFREELLTELNEVQTQIAELAEQRSSALDQLVRLEIIAPRTGRVLGATAHTVGGVIGSGTPVMYIVPADDTLVARVRILPQDIDKVTAGADAKIRFSAFNANTTPEVPGTVSQVSADVIRDEVSGQFFYEAMIEVPNQIEGARPLQILPGMPVDAQVRTESRTVISFLLKPLQDAMATTFRE